MTEASPTLYIGTSAQGDFQLVVLAKTGECWYLTIYPKDAESACAPSTVFRQVTCDASSPSGDYGLWDGQSVKKKLGSASVS